MAGCPVLAGSRVGANFLGSPEFRNIPVSDGPVPAQLPPPARRDARVSWAIAGELNRRLYGTLEQTAVNAFGSVRRWVATHLLDLVSAQQEPAGWPPASRSRSWPTRSGRSARWWPGVLRELRVAGVIATAANGIVILDATRLYAHRHDRPAHRRGLRVPGRPAEHPAMELRDRAHRADLAGPGRWASPTAKPAPSPAAARRVSRSPSSSRPPASPSKDSSARCAPRPATCSSQCRAGPGWPTMSSWNPYRPLLRPISLPAVPGVEAEVARNLGTLKELLESTRPAAQASP